MRGLDENPQHVLMSDGRLLEVVFEVVTSDILCIDPRLNDIKRVVYLLLTSVLVITRSSVTSLCISLQAVTQQA